MFEHEHSIYVRHVETTDGELNDTLALTATAPSLLARELQGLLKCFVSRTVTIVHGCLACLTGVAIACWACGDIADDGIRSDEYLTVWSRAVGTVGRICVEFFFLRLEIGCKPVRESGSDSFPGHRVATASWWVQSLVPHGGCMQLLETAIAVVVGTRCLEYLSDAEPIFA